MGEYPNVPSNLFFFTSRYFRRFASFWIMITVSASWVALAEPKKLEIDNFKFSSSFRGWTTNVTWTLRKLKGSIEIYEWNLWYLISQPSSRRAEYVLTLCSVANLRNFSIAMSCTSNLSHAVFWECRVIMNCILSWIESEISERGIENVWDRLILYS